MGMVKTLIEIRHFVPKEFQCKCCGRGHVDASLVLMLDVLRTYFGQPIRINSGFRCEPHNQEVGGAPGSRHLIGLAADISTPTGKYVDLLSSASRLFRRDGWEFIAYPKKGFIHVAIPRGYALRPWNGDQICIKNLCDSE